MSCSRVKGCFLKQSNDWHNAPPLSAAIYYMLGAKGEQYARGPKGERGPRDVIGNAVHVMRIATGEIEDTITDDVKNAAAVAFGRRGGQARAEG
jgi:hypothetical protein